MPHSYHQHLLPEGEQVSCGTIQSKWCFRIMEITFTPGNFPDVFLGKGVLKICSRFTGEHPCRSVISIKLLWNKVAKQLYWNHTAAWVFSCKFAAYFQITFSLEHLWMAASEKNESNKGEILPQRRPSCSWIICWKTPWEIWSIWAPFDNLPTCYLCTWREYHTIK